MKVEYINRHNEVQTFEVNEKGNIQWKADFEYCRYMFETVPNDTDADPKDITMVDPAGGPYIDLDYNMGMFDKSLDGMIVIGFISNDEGYEIIIKQEI
tara:strand:+ start:32 stop:325 length:294 start_codon:yes stop_codon:yes gene_type:complete